MDVVASTRTPFLLPEGTDLRRGAFFSLNKKSPEIIPAVLELQKLGIVICATQGTAQFLTTHGVPDVIAYKPATYNHRIASISTEHFASLLANPERAEDLEQLLIDSDNKVFYELVCFGFYDFVKATKEPGATYESVNEKIDIGGPAMVMAAAKGGRLVVPENVEALMGVITLIKEEGMVELLALRYKLQVDAMICVTRLYCQVTSYFSQNKFAAITGVKVAELRYGENPHQGNAALYSTGTNDPLAIDKFIPIAGQAGYINITDLDRLLRTTVMIATCMARNFGQTPYIAVGVKHGNSCGAAIGMTPEEALRKMIEGNPEAIFGGSVMVNFDLNEAEAAVLLEYGTRNSKKRPLDVVIASNISDEARALLSRRNDKCKMWENPALSNLSEDSLDASSQYRVVRGGILVQEPPMFLLELSSKKIQRFGTLPKDVNVPKVDIDTVLAYAICATSNSNTITLVRNGALIAQGVAQPSRVEAAEVAMMQIGRKKINAKGAVVASDSFFPFEDAPELLIKAGVIRIFATTGSQNDEKVQALFEGVSCELCQLPDKDARAFFGH